MFNQTVQGIQEEEAGRSWWICGQPGLCSEILSQKTQSDKEKAISANILELHYTHSTYGCFLSSDLCDYTFIYRVFIHLLWKYDEGNIYI